jgi:hypothetical protein
VHRYKLKCLLATWLHVKCLHAKNRMNLYIQICKNTYSFIFLSFPTWNIRPFRGFCDHTYKTHGRSPLDEWSARRRDLYLHRTTQHIKHKRQTSMPREGFEPATTTTKRPQTYALDRAATGTYSLAILKFVTPPCFATVWALSSSFTAFHVVYYIKHIWMSTLFWTLDDVKTPYR